MITLAFYCGRGRLFDRMIRWATRSRFSHIEIVAARYEAEQLFYGFSSSPRDGGVRCTFIREKPDHWEFLTIPGDKMPALAFVLEREGKGYDWLGILLTHVLNLHRDAANSFTCSEIVMTAIGRPELRGLSPGTIYDVLSREAAAAAFA